jgi:hypothetical protein
MGKDSMCDQQKGSAENWPELSLWHDEWTLEISLVYATFLCTMLPEKCMPHSPTWSIMEFVGSAPWWILRKIYRNQSMQLGHFWSGNGDNEPVRLYRSATNYLDHLLHLRPDNYLRLDDRKPEIDKRDTREKVNNETGNLLLKYCKINERAVRMNAHLGVLSSRRYDNDFNTIYDYNSNIRFAHFDFDGLEVEWTKFVFDVLQVMPRLIVVSIPGHWPAYECIKLLAGTAPIICLNFEQERMIPVVFIFSQLPPQCIVVIRYMYEIHQPDKPYFKLLSDEPLRKYLYYNVFSDT